ncbi:MAG: hypothetical protein Q4D61_07690 [Cardiobacteriaceae bacterium]|nr:hypothetical protein [Cardiobacteriaceae bacterium]
MKPIRTALIALGLAAAPLHAADNSNEQELRLGDVFNILLGAYNGAADIAEQRGHPFAAERLSREDAARLERGLNHLQHELQNLVKADGSLDSQRAAQLLNELQALRGEPRIDFVKAEESLRRASNEGQLGFENFLGAVASAALSAEVGELKQLAAQQLGDTPYRGDTILLDLLKLAYADRELGSVDPAREEKAHQLLAHVIAQGHISETRYEDIRKVLGALGRPFRDDYKTWERARDNLVRRELKNREMQDVIGLLQNKELTPEQREQILRALQNDKK